MIVGPFFLYKICGFSGHDSLDVRNALLFRGSLLNDRNGDRHARREDCVFRNVNQLNADGNALCQADPFKGGIDVLQQITSRGILRVADSPCDAVYFAFDWRRST